MCAGLGQDWYNGFSLAPKTTGRFMQHLATEPGIVVNGQIDVTAMICASRNLVHGVF